MSDSWKPIIRVLMYGLEYEDDLLTRAQRTFEVIARAPAAASAEPEDIREAIDQALSSSIDLSTLYEIAGKVVEQSYSDADLRKMLADLSRKLHQQFAKSGEPVPQAGI